MLNFAKSKMILFLVVLFGVVTVANDRIGDPGPGPQSARTFLFRVLAFASTIRVLIRPRQTLYCHMNADHLIVFDVAKRQVLAILEGFANVHGVICAPEENRIYASVTGDHEVAVVDCSSL